MPEEVFIIIVFSILSFTSLMITKMVLDHRREKARSRAGGDAGITTSELEAIVKRAVAQAMQPVVTRLDAMEERALLPPAADTTPLLSEREEEAREKQPARRVRND